jgi:hypothetical protein
MKRSQETCWKKAVAVWAVLFLSQCAGLALAAEDTFKSEGPTLNMDLQLILPDTILLNEPFPITFNVTVNDSVRHFGETPDKIAIALPLWCKVVDGNPVWRGKLSRGSRVTLKITAKFTQPGTESFGGYVRAGAFPRHSAPNESHPTDTDEWYTTYNTIASREYTITGPPPDSVRVDSHGNKVKVYEGHDTHPLPLLSVGQKPSKPAEDSISIIITKQSPQYLGEQKYYRNRTNQITFLIEDKVASTKTKALPKTWSFDCGNCYMKLYPDSTARIGIDAMGDSATLQIEINGTTYKIRFQVRSVTTVRGKFRYVTNLGDTVGGSGTYVELSYRDGSQYVLSDCQITGVDGSFVLATDHDEVRLEFWSYNGHCLVPFSNSCWGVSDPWVFHVLNLNFVIFNPGGYYDVDPELTTICSLDRAGAFNICKYIQKGADYIEQCCGDPGLLLVRWGRNCYQDTRYRKDTLWVNVDGQLTMAFMMVIASKGCDSKNWDEWDPNQILHEYGHHFTNIFAEFPDSCAASHNYIHPTDPLVPFVIPEHLAWNEAFANWFQGVVLGTDSIFDYDQYNVPLINVYFERPNPDVPYCSTVMYGLQVDPSSLTPLWPGGQVEGAVTEALWDIYDVPDDTNFWYGGNIWGHNNDHNQNDSWTGAAAILDVYMNYDPFPSDPHHNHPWDINEFAKGWAARGYPVKGHFQDILLAHAIDVCTSCGDANSDGSIDISDVVFLISLIFAGGTVPADCNYARGMGDANGDGTVDISDVVYLIARVFSGGPAPHCQGM